MAHYAYKCACYDIDYPKFQQLVKQFEEQEGREFDGDSNYDGDNWYIMEMWIRELRAENERLRASPASAPEGFVLVPVEPTEEMLNAMFETRKIAPDDADLIVQYNALLAAAPTPPVSEDQKDAERFREGWTHACNALCMEIALWIERCPHCGMPAPKAPAMQEDKP